MRRLVLVVGLQKSGTSLLFRLLQHSGLAESPFEGEGLGFWGDDPPFTPRGYPTGAIYEAHGGEAGHEATAADATTEMKDALRERLDELGTHGQVLANKNPYNTVRLPWLRTVFPDATIVGVVRRPVANVYSLLKRFEPREGNGLPPEEGWWGVKPAGWRALVGDDKVVQSGRQWAAVNEKLWRDREHLDLIVRYHELCERPGEMVAKIVGSGAIELSAIRCFDDEYEVGSRLRSKNRYYRETGSLETPETEPLEFPPLQAPDVARIEETCGEVAGRFDLT